MIIVDTENFFLKPVQRKQIISHLRRACAIGDRLGNFVLNLHVRHSRRRVEMSARVSDRAGNFSLKVRGSTLADAVHELVKLVSHRLHDQLLGRAAITTRPT